MSPPASVAASPVVSRSADHDNGFGLMRLVFATLVLVSHGPELLDGNRGREILTQVFGGLSFGEFAVDGFFVISGALITASWMNAASARDYLWRRITRIYPGFLAAIAVSVLVVAPLGGAAWPGFGTLLRTVIGALALAPPDIGPVFAGQPYAQLNATMWTISYEFACYLGIAALGLAGALSRPRVILGLAVLALGLAVPGQWPHQVWRLGGLFLVGSLFHLWHGPIPWRRDLALLATLGLVGALALAPRVTPTLVEPGFALFGGYLIFYLAGAARGTVFARINAKNDISYGVYLYGWPIQKLVWWYFPTMPLPLALAATAVLAVGFGWASWLCIERPALRWGRRISGRRVAA